MADGEIDFTSPERLKNQKVKPSGPDLNSKELYNYTTSPRDLQDNQPPSTKMKMAPTIAAEETKMKIYKVKDKTGLSGSIKEIYAHQYDSRRHILIGEALVTSDKYASPKKYPDESMGVTNGIDGGTNTPAPAPSATSAPSTSAAPSAPSRPAPRATAPRRAAPATPAKPATPAPRAPVTTSGDDSNNSYWNQEAERNRAQGGRALPNEFNIFGKKDEAPAAPTKPAAPKAAAPKPTAPSAPLPPQRPKDLGGTDAPKAATPSQRVPEINAPLPAPYGDERKAAPRIEKGPNTAPAGPTDDLKKQPFDKEYTDKFKPKSDIFNIPSLPKKDGGFTTVPKQGEFKLPNVNPMGDVTGFAAPEPKQPSTTITRDALWRSTDPNTTTTRDTLWRSTDPNTTVTKKANTVEEVEKMFSDKELAHMAAIMEANPVSPTDPEINRTARKVGNTDQVGSSVNTNTVSSRDLTDETIAEDYEYDMARNELATAERAIGRLMKQLKGEGNLEAWVQSKITKASDYLDSVADYLESGKVNEETLEEGRGRPPKPGSAAYKRKHGESSSETSDDTTHQGRDPRQHIQVIAGQAAAGRHIDFTHNDGSKSKITPAMGRRITGHLNNLKPAERQTAVNKMHDSSEGLKV